MLYEMLKNLVEGRLYIDKEADEEEAYYEEEMKEWYRTYGDEVTAAVPAAKFRHLGKILFDRLKIRSR